MRKRTWVKFLGCSLCIIFLLFASVNQLFSQAIIDVEVRDGKVIDKTKKATGRIHSFLLSPQQNRVYNAPQRVTSVTAAISVSVATSNASCGGANGSIVAQASGGTPPYSYELSGGYPVQQNGSFYYIRGDNYTLTVRDASAQITTVPVTVTNTNNPPLLSIGSYTRATTCTSSDASVTLAATGGVPPYEYSIDMVNFQPSNTFSNLTPGWYLFWVRDANGCLAQVSSYNISFFSSNACSNSFALTYSQYACTNEGTITFRNLGSDPPYTYSIDGVNYQNSGDFTGLTSGFYTMYSKSAIGEVQLFVFPIYQSCSIKIDFVSVDAACGQNDGALTVNASLGATPYTYTIDGINFQSNNTFTGLAPGVYGVAVRDANGIMNFSSGTVYDKCPELSLTVTDETCAGTDGIITATAVKGTAPYTYSINGTNYQTSNVFTGLAAGDYTIYLKDALGFTSFTPITLNYSCIVVGAAVSTHETCGNRNGSILVVPTTGQAPFMFSIDGTNFQLGSLFTGLAAGTYTVTVKDAMGHSGTTTVTVNNTPAPQMLLVSRSSNCGNSDGDITITATGGRLPYSYSLDGIQYQPSNIFNGLAATVYNVYVKDANGCVTQSSVPVLNRCLGINASVIHETCYSSNGIITVVGVNGTPPYEFSIDGTNFQTGTQFTGIKAGNYTLTVRDAVGHTATNAVVVVNLCPIPNTTVTDGKCTTNGGVIEVTGTNGTAPYEYSINGVDFQTGNTFTGLTTGNYTITIRDAAGLTNTESVQVNNFPSPVLSASSTPVTCINNDGTITLTATGGVSPMAYDIDSRIYQDANVFTNLQTGNYIATVKDANNCTASTPVVIALTNNLTLTMGSDITICEGDKGILPAATNATQFSWTPTTGVSNAALLNPEVSPVTTTTYSLTATLGVCNLSGSVTVNVKPAPVANAGDNSTICFGGDATLVGSGGVSYQWSPATYLDNPQAQQPLVRKPQNSITYSLVVTGANGCRSVNNETVTVTITPPPKVFAGNDTAIMMGQPFQLLAQDVNNSGFVSYTWSPAYGLNNAGIANPVTTLDQNMHYSVTATTAAGCEGKDEINIKVFPGPDIYVPNAFTPNNKNRRNDIFKPILVGIKKLNYFAVYNRWGQRIFYTTQPGIGWDGTQSGKPQSEEMYVWIVEGVDVNNKTIRKKGTVLLIR